MQVIEVVAAVITRGDGRILACRRAPGRTAAGEWEFPGGKVEPGEDPRDALRRELHEELALSARVADLLTRNATTVSGLVIDLACYRVTTEGDGPRESSDHDELWWLTAEELPSVEWALPDLPAVKMLHGGQSSA